MVPDRKFLRFSKPDTNNVSPALNEIFATDACIFI